MKQCSRRHFIKKSIATLPAVYMAGCGGKDGQKISVRPITTGPKFHWFGYYDKYQFDPANRYVLSNEIDFEHRSPRFDDLINVGMVDLKNRDTWYELGHTQTWNWQQGCMLQWLPGSKTKVIWNNRQGDFFGCVILDIKSGRKRFIPHPVYTISPDGRTAMTLDFERVQDMRPGYGYAGLTDPNKDVLAPDNAGIYKVDLETGERQLVISIQQIAKIPYPWEDLSDAKHYFNHLLFSPDGSRFIFLHRWQPNPQNKKRYQNVGGWGTRMLTATPDGNDIHVVDDFGFTSHFIWRDPQHILAWAGHPEFGNHFYLYTDGSKDVEIVGKDVMTRNGHCTYLPGNEWILNDTYPDRQRNQEIYLYHVPTGKKVTLGSFYLPPEYKGEWRVDTHPRFSRDGKSVVFDSAHAGNGRQLYVIDISKII